MNRLLIPFVGGLLAAIAFAFLHQGIAIALAVLTALYGLGLGVYVWAGRRP